VATFKAIVIRKSDAGQNIGFEDFDEKDLMDGDVTVRPEWSTVNYKDGLAITGKAPVVRRFPMIPGVDFAGTVEASTHPDWKRGDKVILNGWGLGETHLGAYAETARVKGDWLVPLPPGMSTRDAMAIGTAGYTAMLAVMALEHHGLRPANGPVLVTGAAGGVGSVAVAILAKLGFNVVAATGRPREADYLKALGATTIMDRKELTEAADRPLLSERFAGLIDTVSGVTFARALAQVKYGGAAAVCGLAAGPAFPGSILPFILRAITVYGIDSVMLPKAPREEAWRRLGSDLPLDKLDSTVSEVGLSDLMPLAPRILKGEVRGRIVVDVAR
jgi:acrylyl-CoA reductase (NADPH)